MNGCQLLDYLNRRSILSKLKVIIISGMDLDIVKKDLSYLIHDPDIVLMEKPVAVDALFNCINNLLK